MSRFNQEENKLNQVLRIIGTINRSKNICLIFLKHWIKRHKSSLICFNALMLMKVTLMPWQLWNFSFATMIRFKLYKMTHCLCCQGPSCIYIVYFFPSLTFLHSVNKCTEFSVKPTNDKFLTGMHHLKIVFYQLMFRTGKIF